MKLFKTVSNVDYPERATDGSVGYDVKAISFEEKGNVLIYDTGVKLGKLPPNTHVKLYPRSSIYKMDLRLANSVGVIDYDYPETIKVIFDFRKDISFGDLKKYEIGDRIAQLVVEPHVVEVEEVEVDEKFEKAIKKRKKTKKRTGGLGSSGR